MNETDKGPSLEDEVMEVIAHVTGILPKLSQSIDTVCDYAEQAETEVDGIKRSHDLLVDSFRAIQLASSMLLVLLPSNEWKYEQDES